MSHLAVERPESQLLSPFLCIHGIVLRGAVTSQAPDFESGDPGGQHVDFLAGDDAAPSPSVAKGRRATSFGCRTAPCFAKLIRG